MDVILSGVVGSTAYGLAGPDSDVDRLGTFAAPTVAFHGLRPPLGKAASHVTTHPDSTWHEAGKFAHLCLGGNPTVSELLWLREYETRTALGDELVAIRGAFLCAPRVRDAYLGYATQQFRRLGGRGDGTFSSDTAKRTEKHARHLLRLCWQGLHLYRTGELLIEVENPDDFHDFGRRVVEQGVAAARGMLIGYEREFDGSRSPLPVRPDEAAVEAWLLRVRAAHWTSEVAS